MIGGPVSKLFPLINAKKGHRTGGPEIMQNDFLYTSPAMLPVGALKSLVFEKLDRHINSTKFVVTHYNLSLQV